MPNLVLRRYRFSQLFSFQAAVQFVRRNANKSIFLYKLVVIKTGVKFWLSQILNHESRWLVTGLYSGCTRFFCFWSKVLFHLTTNLPLAQVTLSVLTPQNDQTHSNNSSAAGDEFFECVLPFFGVGV